MFGLLSDDKHTLRILFVVILGMALVGAQAARADSQGIEIDSMLQGARLVTVVSAEGAKASHYAEDGNPTILTREVIVRYRDGALWTVDGLAHTYAQSNLSAALENRRSLNEKAIATLPPDLSRQEKDTGIVRTRAQAVMRILPIVGTIDNIPIRCFELQVDGQDWRLWVAEKLPQLPPEIRSSLGQLVPADAISKKAIEEFLGATLVRSEARVGSTWVRVLDTSHIRHLTVKTADISAPPGYRPAANLDDKTNRRLPPGGFDVSANVIRGNGPTMSNPEVYLLYWGKELNDPENGLGSSEITAHFGTITSTEYMRYLIQYGPFGPNSAKVKSIYHRTDLPPRAVGDANFVYIDGFVSEVGYQEGAPIFWWSIGGHDPFYAVMVAEDEVDGSLASGGWPAYHFYAYVLTEVLLPFPISLAAHDIMPWQIVKIPLSQYKGDYDRAKCDRFLTNIGQVHQYPWKDAPWSSALKPECSMIDRLDEATQSISHEMVETITDPYVFLGWADLTKWPPNLNSEISDICQNPTPRWGPSVVLDALAWTDPVATNQPGQFAGVAHTRGGTSVATYWSNGDHACVPESGPTLTLLDPADGSTITTVAGGSNTAQVTYQLNASALDPGDGDISDEISWVIDGMSRQPGGHVAIPMLPVGPHKVTAQITNLAGVTRSVTHSFFVSANAPRAVIYSPLNGSSFGSDALLVLRGSGTEYSLGDIPDSKLQWSDGLKLIGTGSLVSYRPQTTGIHLIGLTATNGAGEKGIADVIIHVTAPTGKPSVEISYPLNNAVFPVANGQNRSAAINFKFRVTDGAGSPVPTAHFSLVSSVDGGLGNGQNVHLRGGSCSPWTHKITLTATLPSGATSSDDVVVQVGQVC